MYDLIRYYLGRIVANYVGASVRWAYGTVWRTIFNKPKYTYSEYVNGPNDSDDHFDEVGHQFNNRIIGIITIGLFAGLIVFLT